MIADGLNLDIYVSKTCYGVGVYYIHTSFLIMEITLNWKTFYKSLYSKRRRIYLNFMNNEKMKKKNVQRDLIRLF